MGWIHGWCQSSHNLSRACDRTLLQCADRDSLTQIWPLDVGCLIYRPQYGKIRRIDSVPASHRPGLESQMDAVIGSSP